MIQRFNAVGCTDFEDDSMGVLVTYHDHAAEMREVLEALRLYAGPHGGDVKGFEAWFAVNKYAHYLEEK